MGNSGARSRGTGEGYKKLEMEQVLADDAGAPKVEGSSRPRLMSDFRSLGAVSLCVGRNPARFQFLELLTRFVFA